MEAQAISESLVRSLAHRAAESCPPVGQGGEGADDARVQRVPTALVQAPESSVSPGEQPAPLEMAGAFSVQIVASLARRLAETGSSANTGTEA